MQKKDVKQVLYAVIDDIGKEKIRADVSSNIQSSEKYCAEIMRRCIQDLGDEAKEGEATGILCEALLHFMLTASLLPSERKVTVDGGIELDLVIPSVKNLAKNPDKTLVVQIIKTSADIVKISQAQAVQKNIENIWTISARKIEYKGRNYHLGEAEFQYPSIVSDIHTFLVHKGVSSLKMLHG
ncbi:MAG TPA: hypothetical protein VHA09_09135 [Nitrososphaera sp.]|nr:hypothetical protein [Nitrososphaera sp.]